MLVTIAPAINREQNPPNPTTNTSNAIERGRLLARRVGFVCLRQATPTRLLVLSQIDRINPPLQLARLM